MKPIEIDGSTGEGGGQLVRNAIALAAVTCQPVKITNVRGNRQGPRGAGGGEQSRLDHFHSISSMPFFSHKPFLGLKSQHVTSIAWLANATAATVSGLEIGSKTLTFSPSRGPGGLLERNITIRAESPAASALLIFQAVLPFLLFAGNERAEPVELTISGGTNVSFSLSYEYLDQVLLPALHRWFGVIVERKLLGRGWSAGSASRGELWFRIQPLALGSTLSLRASLDLGDAPTKSHVITSVDITIITPADMHKELEEALRHDITKAFPAASVNLVLAEESKSQSRIYVLAVAKSDTDLRWGRDDLYNKKRKGKTIEALSKEISRCVSRALLDEIQKDGVVDEFLQDQLVIFQALAEGRTTFPRLLSQDATEGKKEGEGTQEIEAGLEQLRIEEKLHKDKVKGPLGDADIDSTHTMTARWVASEILEPGLKWYNKGTVCHGVGLVSGPGKV